MLRFLTFLGGAFALGLALISIGANFWFGTLLTVGHERWVYGGIFALLDGFKTVLLPLAVASFAAGAIAKGRTAIGVFALLSAISFTAEIGLYATTKSEVVGDAKAAHQRYADAKAAKAKAETDLAAIGTVRSAGDIDADMGVLKRDRLYDRSKQCAEATAAESRDLCARLDRLAGEKQKAEEAVRLRNALDISTAALALVNVAAAMRSIDPQAEALAKLLSVVVAVEPDTVRTALAVLIALLIELGSGLGPWLASPSHRKPETSAETVGASLAAGTAVEGLPVADDATGDADAEVARWAANAIVRRRGSFVPASEMRAAFEAFCQAEGAEVANPTAFGKAMTRLGFDRAKRGGVMRYEGVALTVPARSPVASIRVAVDNTTDRRALGHMAVGGRAH